ncbi:alpha/beta hydrolase [Nodosilinea sp. LEGE 07088]|uniref:alpha/beta hydrolase n=1 Tax=Nodosilinea sp. LEGE 07088 TaxID=2777968 RepID=UPI00187EDB62|nr:alpha/beta hydrolase [Nodosilinea sp. LEGE 07088]MBE9136062.1 alpha/beta hydrolase [Nodosilinea sp. LEGE 07088]
MPSRDRPGELLVAGIPSSIAHDQTQQIWRNALAVVEASVGLCSRWPGRRVTSLVGGLLIALAAGEAAAAERISIHQGLFAISISVEALEQFAATGVVPPELRHTVGRLDEQAQALVRQKLNAGLDIDVVAMSQLANSALGDDYLARMGNLVRTEVNDNGALGLRAAHVAAAQDPEGVTAMGVIRHFPTDIRISVPDLRYLNRQWDGLTTYKLAAFAAIQQQAQREVDNAAVVDFSRLPDLRQPGPVPFAAQTITLVDADRPSPFSEAGRTFDVDVYLPQTQSAAPVVVISHGWGSSKESFAFLAQHLASYGFAVVVPQHIGSDRIFQQRFLSGLINEDIPPREYIDRPLDITYTLDELARRSAAPGPDQGRFDLERVGVIGHSLGGYTALAIAGATINYPLLQRACVANRPLTFNLSVYLQCRAAPLTPVDLSLDDPRIDAVMALNPIDSVVQGPAEIAQIAIPTLLVSANVDLLATPIQEQIHPFTWLTTDHKYLVTMAPAGHGSSVQSSVADHTVHGGLAPNTALGSEYSRALATAFMQRYVAQDLGYQPFLSAAYAAYLNADPIALNLVQSLTAEQLEAAYGAPSPLPIRPKP